MFYTSIFFLLILFLATINAVFLPQARSFVLPLNSSALFTDKPTDGPRQDYIPSPSRYPRYPQKQPTMKSNSEFGDREEMERSIEEDGDERREGQPPDVSRMPAFYRRRPGYGSNRGRGFMGPLSASPFIRPQPPYGYGSNYMLPTSSPDRYEIPYQGPSPQVPPMASLPYRPPMHYRRPRRPYDSDYGYQAPIMPPYMGHQNQGPPPGPYSMPYSNFGPPPPQAPYMGYGRLTYGSQGKSPMDWQDGGDLTNGAMPDEGNAGMGLGESGMEEMNPNGGSRLPDGEVGVGVYMSSYGYSYAGYIERQAKMYPIMMYTLVGCNPCQRAKHLLAINYADIRSHFLELVGNEDWQRQLQVDLQHITGAVTFPYIFICGTYIGGSSDLFTLHQSGQLRRMVTTCSSKL